MSDTPFETAVYEALGFYPDAENLERLGKALSAMRWNLAGVSGALCDAGDIVVCDDDYSTSIRELTAQRDTLRKVADAAQKVNEAWRYEYGSILRSPALESKLDELDIALTLLDGDQ